MLARRSASPDSASSAGAQRGRLGAGRGDRGVSSRADRGRADRPRRPRRVNRRRFQPLLALVHCGSLLALWSRVHDRSCLTSAPLLLQKRTPESGDNSSTSRAHGAMEPGPACRGLRYPSVMIRLTAKSSTLSTTNVQTRDHRHRHDDHPGRFLELRRFGQETRFISWVVSRKYAISFVHRAHLLGRRGRDGRGGRIRTRDPRFWRPMLYQLSYTPASYHRDMRRRPRLAGLLVRRVLVAAAAELLELHPVRDGAACSSSSCSSSSCTRCRRG